MTVQKLLLPIILLLFTLATFPQPTIAQIVNQLAYNVEVKDSNVSTGDLVSLKSSVYQLSTSEYDAGLYGVVDTEPQVSINKITTTSKPVVVSGQALVKVTESNGEIKAGDLITTSNDKGIGQKATKSGHVLGKALKDFPDSSSEEVVLLPVLVNINYNQVSAQSESLTQAGIDQVADKVSSSIVSGNIPDILKYIFALLLGTISFFVGLSHFVRSNRTAVEAIARNPLAKADIQRQLIVGTGGILFICGIGLAIAVWILLFL